VVHAPSEKIKNRP